MLEVCPAGKNLMIGGENYVSSRVRVTANDGGNDLDVVLETLNEMIGDAVSESRKFWADALTFVFLTTLPAFGASRSDVPTGTQRNGGGAGHGGGGRCGIGAVVRCGCGAGTVRAQYGYGTGAVQVQWCGAGAVVRCGCGAGAVVQGQVPWCGAGATVQGYRIWYNRCDNKHFG